MFSHWFPAKERSFLISAANSGAYIGTAVAFPVSGALINIRSDPVTGVSTSWPLVFYCFGGVGIAWWCLWQLLVSSTPDADPTITPAEREYLNATTKQDADVNVEKVVVHRSASPPWRGFATSSAAWVYMLMHAQRFV